MAKLHVRHMVGGHAPRGRATRSLYRFEFPERPGALMNFLDSMSARLEHQPVPLPQPRRRLRPGAGRHAGAAARQMADFRRFLDRLGYTYVDETANPAYRMFLGR